MNTMSNGFRYVMQHEFEMAHDVIVFLAALKILPSLYRVCRTIVDEST